MSARIPCLDVYVCVRARAHAQHDPFCHAFHANRQCITGLIGSLKPLLQSRFEYSSFQAGALVSAQSAFAYVAPFVGGYLADEKWGRFRTVAVFGIIYLGGVALMALSIIPGHVQQTIFFLALFLVVSLGMGGLKANIVTLGGDQFSGDQGDQKESFFNAYYWSINFGFTIAFATLSQLATRPSGAIPDGYGFFWVYVICGATLLIGYIAFVSGFKRYILRPANGGTFRLFGRVFRDSLQRTWQGHIVLLGALLMSSGFLLSVFSAFYADAGLTRRLAIAGCVCAAVGTFLVGAMCVQLDWVGDSEDREVELAKEIWRVVPAQLCGTSFWVAYAQMGSNFYAQSCQMDLNVNGWQLNAALLHLADSVAIMICIPLFKTYLYPLIERCKGSKFTIFQKMGCGFIVTVAALVAASVIEIERRRSGVQSFRNENMSYSNCAPRYEGDRPNTCEQDASGFMGKGTCMNNLSVFWMVIPYFLIGIGECLIPVQLYELSYSEVCEEMQSTAQAIHLSTLGLASAVAAGLTVGLQKQIPDDLNRGHVEYAYYTVIGIQVVTFVCFLVAVQNFRYNYGYLALPRDNISASEEQSRVTTPMSPASEDGAVNGAYDGDEFGVAEPEA